MTLTIRAATPADASAIRALTYLAYAEHAELAPTPKALSESTEVIAAELAEQGGLLAELDREVVGALRHGIEEDGRRWMRRVAVHPRRRRHGIGTALVRAAVTAGEDAGAPGVHLGVRHALADTRAWYLRLGFRLVREHALWSHLAHPVPVVLPDAAATRALGERLAGLAREGDLVILAGPLGAGKTTLAQGFGAGLGVPDVVRSPTYTVVDEHHGGRLRLVHADAYRLGSPDELDDLDLDLADAVTLVEWGEGRAEVLGSSRLLVRLDRPADGPDRRLAALEPQDEDWARRLSVARLL
jgi:tRNA threonylcarbamoyladenosine biosynthesis protein TsaE